MTDRIRKLLVGIVVPVLIGLGGVAAILTSLPELPDPVAIHWGPTGEPDGFGPATTNLVLLLVFIVVYGVISLIVARGKDGFSVTQKALLATAPFLAVLLTAVLAGSLVLQRGLEDATQAPSVLPLLGVGTVAGLVVGVGAWFLLPRTTQRVADEATVPTLQLGATERGAWIRRSGPSGAVQLFVIGTLVLVSAVAIVALVLSAPPLLAVIYGGVLLLIALFVSSTVYWRVRVTDEGLEARSALGIPRFAVPLREVAEATVITVNPVRDFGGWGLRWGGQGRFGIVTHAGEALEVRRTNGKSLIVTVDDASQAASLLNALRARVSA